MTALFQAFVEGTNAQPLLTLVIELNRLTGSAANRAAGLAASGDPAGAAAWSALVVAARTERDLGLARLAELGVALPISFTLA